MNKAIVSSKGRGGDLLVKEVPYPNFDRNNHVIIEQKAFGINYDDIKAKDGRIENPNPYGILGIEAAGIIQDVAPECKKGYKKGNIVCYATYEPGAFVQYRSVSENYITPVPRYMHYTEGATLLKGLMAYTLLGKIFIIDTNSTIVLTGASGAVGSIVSQLASKGKMRIIAITSNDTKREYLESKGALLVINYKKEDVVSKIMRFTNNIGADYFFDCLGLESEPFAFACLRTRGFFIQFGAITGESKNITIERQRSKSIISTRVMLGNFITNYNDFMNCTFAYMKSIQAGIITPTISKYAFNNPDVAFMDIKSAKTVGQKVFVT